LRRIEELKRGIKNGFFCEHHIIYSLMLTI
jgi:hypothetical protein